MKRRGANLFLLNDLLPGADHVDVHSLRAAATLREVIAAALGGRPPWWVEFLVRVRGVVAKILGLKHEHIPQDPVKPEQVPFKPGQSLQVFVVAQAKEDEYWISELMEDKHLRGWVAVLAEPSTLAETAAAGVREFHLVTVVRYKHWTGWLYFNLIRPFHHLIVWTACRSAEKQFARR